MNSSLYLRRSLRMRKVTRLDLPSSTSRDLEGREERVRRGADVTIEWKVAGRTTAIRCVRNTLEKMIERSRCYYCGDSRGTDAEHFWPKRKYPQRAFRWCNLLLACAGCNRQKGEQFPLDQSGAPLLIDPTKDDPWDHLFYDVTTGQLVPRWLVDYQEQDPKGRATCGDEILPLNIEAIGESRKKTARNLVRVVEAFLSDARTGDFEDAVESLKLGIRDQDDHGLASWFFGRDGREEEPFKNLRKQYPEVWRDLLSC